MMIEQDLVDPGFLEGPLLSLGLLLLRGFLLGDVLVALLEHLGVHIM